MGVGEFFTKQITKHIRRGKPTENQVFTLQDDTRLSGLEATRRRIASALVEKLGKDSRLSDDGKTVIYTSQPANSSGLLGSDIRITPSEFIGASIVFSVSMHKDFSQALNPDWSIPFKKLGL